MTAPGSISTASLLRLLEEGSSEEICAAALVFGAHRVSDARVRRALKRRLETADAPLRPYLLDALGKLSDPRAVRDVAEYLDTAGSLRDQAARLLIGHEASVTEELRRLHRRHAPGVLQPIVWVAANRGTPDLVDLLVDMAASADHAGGRTLVTAVRKAAEDWPASTRRHLCSRLATLLAGDARRVTDGGLIAALRLLPLTGDPRCLTPLLAHVGEAFPPDVRRHALEGLADAPLPARRRGAIVRAVAPLVGNAGSHATGALRVLRRLDPPALDVATAVRLARDGTPDVARIAFSELARHDDAQARTMLIREGLRHEDARVREAAACCLATLPDMLRPVLTAYLEPGFASHRDLVGDVLTRLGHRLDGRGYAAVVRSHLGAPDEDDYEVRLRALAALDPERLNRSLETRARRLLKEGGGARAVATLEPLVRCRLASPEGRYLLAIAHVQQELGQEASIDRASQLLGPLARLESFPLRVRLDRERSLDTDGRRRLRAAMERGSGALRRCLERLRR